MSPTRISEKLSQIYNIGMSARMASDVLMFDEEGKQIEKEKAMKAGSPKDAGVKYLAFYIKRPDHLELHTYHVEESDSEKSKAISSAVTEWPDAAKAIITEKWGIELEKLVPPPPTETVDTSKVTPGFIV